MRKMYTKACRYSYVLSNGSSSYKDDVHQAFIYYFNKTGQNLFEQNEYYVMACVKWMNKWRYATRLNKHFIEIENFPVTSNFLSPLQELESNETIDRIYTKLKSYSSGHGSSIDPNQLVTFLFFLERGYEIKEIAEMMGVTMGMARNYVIKIRSILRELTGVEKKIKPSEDIDNVVRMLKEGVHPNIIARKYGVTPDHIYKIRKEKKIKMQIANPFNGSRVTISKKITRKWFDTNNEKFADYVYDTERDCDSNEFYEIRVNSNNEYLLIREKGE